MNNILIYGVNTRHSQPMGVHHVHLPSDVYGTYRNPSLVQQPISCGDQPESRGTLNCAIVLLRKVGQASMNNMIIYGVYTRHSLSMGVHHGNPPSDVYGTYRNPSLVLLPISCGDRADNRSTLNGVFLSRDVGQASMNNM